MSAAKRRLELGGLTPKEAAFVAEWMVDKNATQAAIRAGYKDGPGARIQAQRMLKMPRIKAAMDRALAEQINRGLTTAEDNLLAIDRIATEAERAGKFGEALRGRELLGKHYGSFRERMELTGKDGEAMKVSVEFVGPNP